MPFDIDLDYGDMAFCRKAGVTRDSEDKTCTSSCLDEAIRSYIREAQDPLPVGQREGKNQRVLDAVLPKAAQAKLDVGRIRLKPYKSTPWRRPGRKKKIPTDVGTHIDERAIGSLECSLQKCAYMRFVVSRFYEFTRYGRIRGIDKDGYPPPSRVDQFSFGCEPGSSFVGGKERGDRLFESCALRGLRLPKLPASDIGLSTKKEAIAIEHIQGRQERTARSLFHGMDSSQQVFQFHQVMLLRKLLRRVDSSKLDFSRSPPS